MQPAGYIDALTCDNCKEACLSSPACYFFSWNTTVAETPFHANSTCEVDTATSGGSSYSDFESSCELFYLSWMGSGTCPQLFEYMFTAAAYNPFFICSQDMFNHTIAHVASSEWDSCNLTVVSPLLKCMYAGVQGYGSYTVMDICDLPAVSPWDTCSSVFQSWQNSGACSDLMMYIEAVSNPPDLFDYCSGASFLKAVAESAGSEWANCSQDPVSIQAIGCYYNITMLIAQSNSSQMDSFDVACSAGATCQSDILAWRRSGVCPYLSDYMFETSTMNPFFLCEEAIFENSIAQTAGEAWGLTSCDDPLVTPVLDCFYLETLAFNPYPWSCALPAASPWDDCATAFSSWQESGSCPGLTGYLNTTTSKGNLTVFCSQQSFVQAVVEVAGSDWGSCSSTAVATEVVKCYYNYAMSMVSVFMSNSDLQALFTGMCTEGSSAITQWNSVLLPSASTVALWDSLQLSSRRDAISTTKISHAHAAFSLKAGKGPETSWPNALLQKAVKQTLSQITTKVQGPKIFMQEMR